MGIHQMLLMKSSAPAVKKPGFTPKYDGFGTILHSNSGSATSDYVFGGAYGVGPLVGIEDFDSETLSWSLTWAPLYSDPTPSLSPSGDITGRYEVNWPSAGGAALVPGLLTIAVSVNGTLSPDTLQISVAEGGYATVAWGPTP